MNDSLLTMSGAQIAEMIRRGTVTSREAVEVHIEKIMKVNPVINAVVKDRFEEARKEADAADRKRKSSAGKNLPPYHGVPCTIKEAYATERDAAHLRDSCPVKILSRRRTPPRSPD